MRNATHRALQNSEVSAPDSGAACALVEPAQVELSPAVENSPERSVKLTRQEVSRKLWHMSAGLVPFVVPFLPYYSVSPEHWGLQGLRLMVIGTAFVLMSLSLVYSKRFARPNERSIAKAMSCYALPVLALLLLFPAQLQLGFAVLAIVAIGDGAAGLIGMTLRGPRLLWNPGKTVTGTLAFMLFGIPVATAAYWFSAQTAVTWGESVSIVTAAALAAAVAESIPSSIDDNLRVGTAAAMVMAVQRWMMH